MKKLSMRLFSPNRCRGKLNLSLDVGDLADDTKLILQNSLGQTVLQSTLKNSIETINLSRFENGIYLLSIFKEGMKIYAERVVVGE